MQAGGRFGGHIVQGHVDGTGDIVSRERMKPTPSCSRSDRMIAQLMRYVIPQGSVTLDGISLTVVAWPGSERFTVSIIPHTLAETALQHKAAGAVINIECDMLGKYVDHLLHYKEVVFDGWRQAGGAAAAYRQLFCGQWIYVKIAKESKRR